MRLEEGLPDLHKWGEQLLEPFVVYRLRNASVIWLNNRWFLERGFNTYDVRDERRIVEWLLAEYAFVVKDVRDPETAFSGEHRLAGADRYGSTPGGPPAGGGHGGSGRTGTIGRFQIKGIGVTPLVGVNAKWDHAQGWAGLEEALTEAIMAEVVCEEFPYGGVPVIAVIDTGLFQHPPDSPPNRYRRALMIRPAVLRPAHMQRAPLFLESIHGAVQEPQRDVARTHQFIAHFQNLSPSERRYLDLPSDLRHLARRLAVQAAFGDVHRLFGGGLFSSNVSLDGRIIDYGAMRALESWAKVSVHDHLSGFGSDSDIIQTAMESLAFYAAKANKDDVSTPTASELREVADSTYRLYRSRYLASMWGIHTHPSGTNAARPIASILLKYFEKQQRYKVRHNDRTHLPVPSSRWLYGFMSIDPAESEASHDDSDEFDLLSRIGRVIREATAGSNNGAALKHLFWATAMRYCKPRELLDRARLRAYLHEHALNHDPRLCPTLEVVTKAVASIVGTSRRHWTRLPHNLIVVEQVYNAGSTALRCIRMPERRPVLWAEGLYLAEQASLRWFNSIIPEREIAAHAIRYRNGRWSCLFPIEPLPFRNKGIPPMQLVYREVNRQWVH